MANPDYRKRLWVCNVPLGQWSQGPVILYDFGPETEKEREKLREENWSVEGPYVLQEDNDGDS